MAPVVRRVEPRSTRSLRIAVLRPGHPPDRPLQGDDAPDTVALGVEAAGHLVGCCLLLPETAPEIVPADARRAIRLRGMAVLPEHRGGLGTALLEAALAAVAEDGGDLLWCHARVPARRLYERGGFLTAGEPFEEVGLPHVLMWRRSPTGHPGPAGAGGGPENRASH